MKYCSAKEALLAVKSGDRVGTGHAMGQPDALLDALVARADELRDVELVHLVSFDHRGYGLPEHAKSFRHNALFVGGPFRKAVEEGRADFTPCFFHQVPRLFSGGPLPLDVALVQISKPDVHGYASLGVSVDYTRSMVENAKIVIAQVNDQMPRTMGNAFVHISQFDYLVEESRPLGELPRSPVTSEEAAIGMHCASLVPDGATLQLGIGSIPDAVLSKLTDKKDLGIHSEMFSDGVVDLVEAGVITGRKKTLHPGKMVATFLMGSKRLYDFIDNNPMVHMEPVDYVNDPWIAAQNDKLVAINSCVQVDLMGQVCSETVGHRQISGVGGQVDFVRAASMSKGGAAIIAMASTTKNGTISKIVADLDAGAAVTTGRCDVGYIVTENGIADLRGQTLRERGRRLIEIAHKNFQPQLWEEWERRFHTKMVSLTK